MKSSSSYGRPPVLPRGAIIKKIVADLVNRSSDLATPNSEENIPLVTLDAAPNDAQEEQVPNAAARESEEPIAAARESEEPIDNSADSLASADNSADSLASVDNLAKPNSEKNIPLVTLDVAPNDAEEKQVSYTTTREFEASANNLAPTDNLASAVNLAQADNLASTDNLATADNLAPADNLAKPNSEEWIFLVTNLCMEILSAACDQASSPSRPRYALFGMLLAIAALLTCICELIYKGRKNNVLRRKRECCMLFGSDIEIFGLVGGLAQCVCSIIQYLYYIRRAENPIKLSLLPAIFLICLIAARLRRNQMQTRDETDDNTT